MLVDRSARIWAMRHDEMMVADAVNQREAMRAPEAVMHGAPLEGSDFTRIVDGVAVVPVRGMLMRQYSYWFWSYEEILRDVSLAQASPLVRSILLHVDSGGGLVAGCGDAAREIRDSGPKPIEAFVGGMCASAAYYISSAADRIILGSGTTVGSIGTVIEYVDLEPMIEKMGGRIVRVVAEQSPNKRLDPDSPEGKAEMQALVDAGAAEFIADVAEFRGISDAEVLSQYGQGLLFDGSEAIRRGMADDRGTIDTIIAELAGRDVTQAVPAPAAQETPMDWESITLAGLREHRAELVSDIERAATAAADTARDEAVAAAIEEERGRIAAIDEIAVPGHEDLVAAAKADGRSAAQLALDIVKADKAAGGQHLAALREADARAAVPPLPQAGEPEVTTGGTDEEKAEATWAKDADLRAEFGGDRDAYLAWAKANASGRARVLRRAS